LFVVLYTSPFVISGAESALICAEMAEHRGAAQDYYQENGDEQYQPPPGPPPPQTRQYYTPGPPPPQAYGQYGNESEKLDFQNTFKVERPKFNDWWAGLLFLIVFAGFTAVSAISLTGYSEAKGSEGGGIYDGNGALGLNTSVYVNQMLVTRANVCSIIAFAFVLGIATVLSYSYVWMARLFPKVGSTGSETILTD
jgi:hypothetical protein